MRTKWTGSMMLVALLAYLGGLATVVLLVFLVFALGGGRR